MNAANYCTMRYYLRYVLKNQPARLSAYVKGSLLHAIIEHFWDKFGTPEETRDKKTGKKYFDAESFAKHCQRQWVRIMKADETAPGKIAWRFDQEKWSIYHTMPKICRPLFGYLFAEGKPTFIELPFDFLFADERFVGRIDEVRVVHGKIVLRDYKSGNPWVGEMKLRHDPQLSLYNVGLCFLAQSNPRIRAALGLEGRLDELMAGARFASPLIEEQFFMIEALSVDPQKVKTMPLVVNPTTRRDENFLELISMIKCTKERLDTGNVCPERGKKCDICDMSDFCDQELKKVGTGTVVDKSGQSFFSAFSPRYIRGTNSEGQNLISNQKVQVSTKPLPSVLRQKRIRFQYKRGGIVCGTAAPEQSNLNFEG